MCEPSVCARGRKWWLNQWPEGHNVSSLCLTLQPPSGEASAPEGFVAAPATGKWDRGTEGGSGLIHRTMGPSQLPSRAEQGPLQASSWGLEALVRVVSPPITSSLTRKRADGREVGMEVGLDAQPDHGSPPNSLAGWREQGMGKSVRAAGGGISGRGECDGGGARKEHSALNPPTPSALP